SFGSWIREGGYNPYNYYNLRIPFFEANPKIEDSVKATHLEIRTKELQPFVDSLLSPFYMSITEVTNKEYRDFVNWVRDSIARDLIYMGLENDEEADVYIEHSEYYITDKPENHIDDEDGEPWEKWDAYEISDRDINRKAFSLNWDQDFSYSDPELVRILAEMYYPQPERFYKRREFDVRKFNYTFDNGKKLNTYPDTVGFVFLKWNSFSPELLTNMYFWHPAYDQYPVVNVSYEQILAYCEWKQKQVNKNLKEESVRIQVTIPTISQYEFALKYSVPYTYDNEVHDKVNGDFSTYKRKDTYWGTYLNRVNRNIYEVHKKDDFDQKRNQMNFNRWYEANFNNEFRFINGNVSEIVRDPLSKNSLAHYGIISDKPATDLIYTIGGNYFMIVKTLGDDQYNAPLYKRAMIKNKSEATSGFRVVYTISTIEK
ncbi:MAG: SUMF1/EgtB/PvdO family nonheme iron enzyme, partial [Crocinitomicaceae bacterium]|nr:SUMF1/EgtB/PvdO family nonheme iron enzyme [Crocinitomicaceae bacterium]